MELQIEARNLELRQSWKDRIEQEIEKLLRHHPGLVHHLRATVEGTKQYKEGGYELLVVASVPNDTVVVKKRGEKVTTLIVEAFDTLGLQLKEMQRKKRQTFKTQDTERFNALDEATEAGAPE